MEGIGRRRIYLMRHGHVDYFAPEAKDPRYVSLTDEGREQAAAAGAALKAVSFDLAVCSGLPRARQTASIILKSSAGAPPLEDSPGLEELKSGQVMARSREELAAMLAFSFDDAASDGASFLPGGETFKSAETRITRALTNLIFDKHWRTALIVAHEGVNRIALGWACGGGLKTIASFEQDLCCVNVIDIDVTPTEDNEGLQIERTIVKALNVTPYDLVKRGLTRTSLEHLFDVDFGAARPDLRNQRNSK